MNWKISLSDLDIGQEEIAAVTEVLQSKWLTMGPVTQDFETAFAQYLGVKHAFAVANCTAALHIAHQVLGAGPDDEIISPALTFVATANSILYTGATPVFADVTSLDDLNVSPENILSRITPKTKGISVVHYAGYPCDMERVMQIAQEHNLYVVEDVAHAPGANLNGKKLGTFGQIGCFSFFSNKNLVTGEGGMVVTNDDELAEKIKRVRSHGMTSLTWDRHKGHAYAYDVTDLGYNYRIDEIRAAIGLVQLKKLEQNNELRATAVETYHKMLHDVEELTIPFSDYRGHSSHHIFPVVLAPGVDTNQFRTDLREQGIQTSMHYPPVHLFSHYQEKFGYTRGLLPVTEEISEREVTLPLYPTLESESIAYIVNAIRAALKRQKQVPVIQP